jgi:signal transduction histidine kinase
VQFDWTLFRLVTAVAAGIICFLLATLAYLKNPQAKLNLSFARFNLFLGLWNISDVVIATSGHDRALLFCRFSYVWGTLVIPEFVSMTLAFSGRTMAGKLWKRIFIISTVFLVASTFSPWLIKDVKLEPYFEEVPGPLYLLYGIYFLGGLAYGVSQVALSLRHSRGVKKKQLRYLTAGFVVAFFAGFSYIVSMVNPNAPPLFYVLEALYNIIVAISIIRYKLMDINLVFRYATIYLLFAISLTIPFSLVPIFLDSKVAVVLTVFSALFFSPNIEKKVIGAFQRFVDKLPPFRGRYEFLNNTPGFQRLISSSASVKHWAANLADSVNRLLEVSNTAVFVFDENHQMYMAMSAVGVDFGKMIYASPKENDTLVLHLKTTRKTLQKEYVEYEVAQAERQSVLNSLSLIKAELCVPFFNGDRLLGFVSVGPKHKRGVHHFRPDHFNLNSILEYLDFAPTSTPAFAYVHRLLCAELGIQKSGDAFKLSALQVSEGFNRLVNRAGWVEKIPRVEHLQLHSEGMSLLDRLKSRTADHVVTLMPVEEATLNAAVLAYFYQAELRGYWREDNFNDEDTKALSGLVQGAEGALMVIFVTLAGQMKSVEWAHDLRHPFVKGSFRVLDALLTGKMGPLTADQYHALAHIQADAKFVESRITDLVSPENSGIIKKKQININDLLHSVGERYRYFAGISGIDFRLTIPLEDVWVQCDAELIQYRVFNNILDNAMRHTPKGGIVELGVRSVGKGALAHCYVRNTGGTPITKEALPHLFERGSPSKRPTSGQSGLAGLGLFNVEKVVSAHGGKIEVKSTQEEGTIFEFTLPLAGVGVQPK